AWLEAELAAAEDKTPVIVQSGLENRAPIARAALDLFLSILGSEAGNLVLQVLATGGVYLGGGIPPRILDELRGETFHQAFVSKGRFTQLLDSTPVQVIVNSKAALFGAANHCQQVLRGELEY
ncbi:MAG: glucokinase, partial [Candidatus Promineifilaceae bacterium]|nr:glucokinase [Candidatus Promineifilaceae bacterium]